MAEDIMWSKEEKDIARQAYNMALEREGLDLLVKLTEMATSAKDLGDIWRIHDFLTGKREEFDQKYDYRYSVLIPVFGALVKEGWLRLDELAGLAEDKIAQIRTMSGLE